MTATEARKIAAESKNYTFAGIAEEIECYAMGGYTTMKWKYKITEEARKELESNGYILEDFTNGTTIISW